MQDLRYNQKLEQALVGRRLNSADIPVVHFNQPQLRFWGYEAGITGSDIHSDRLYRIWITYDEELIIHQAQVFVDGELISPCSGFAQETLDQFDYDAVLHWCMARTQEVS